MNKRMKRKKGKKDERLHGSKMPSTKYKVQSTEEIKFGSVPWNPKPLIGRTSRDGEIPKIPITSFYSFDSSTFRLISAA